MYRMPARLRAPSLDPEDTLLLTLALSLTLHGFIAGIAPQNSPGEELPPLWQLVGRLAEENGFAADLAIIEADMKGVARQMPRGGYKRVAHALEAPWSVPALCEEVAAIVSRPFAQGRVTDFAPLFDGVSELVDLGTLELDETPWQELRDETVIDDELLEALATLMERATELARESTRALSEEQIRELAQNLLTFGDLDFRWHDPKNPLSSDQLTWCQGFGQVLAKCSLQGCLRAARLLAPLADAAFLTTLERRLAKLTEAKADSTLCSGDIVTVLDWGATGKLVVGGRGKTVYKGPATLIIDLGGNDTYESAAVADAHERPLSVILDLRGNDTYLGRASGPVHACGGVSLLVDLAGKDRYEGERFGSASGAGGGVAILVDHEGNDTYVTRGYGQGCGLCGVGLLYDRKGNDTYDGACYAQGATRGGGLGALVDWEGNDSYLADGVCPDTYGDSGPNIYHGGSQGNSWGTRHLTMPGGFGVLIDHAGKDRYQAGNFSQGGGYYFAFGLLLDEGGDDERYGCRYSQGYGVHQATGVHWDRGGDDKYNCRSVANAGCCWDQGVGYLIDDQGDDTYNVGGLALGGSANTGFAFLLDREGSDSYTSTDVASQGGSGDSSYHEKPSLGLLIDFGKGKDQYGRPKRKDSHITWQPWYGVCVDAPERTLEDLLERKPGRLRGEEIEGTPPPQKK
ncbi:MAG: hypothetical protein AB1486_11440 [Planctomycetota bacterium]